MCHFPNKIKRKTNYCFPVFFPNPYKNQQKMFKINKNEIKKGMKMTPLKICFHIDSFAEYWFSQGHVTFPGNNSTKMSSNNCLDFSSNQAELKVNALFSQKKFLQHCIENEIQIVS